MNILVVYAHPSQNSFTHMVKEKFVSTLTNAGHNVVVSDLYQMNFNETFTEEEYNREAFYNAHRPVSEDVRLEQEKVNNADVIAFIYPIFWTEAPAKLVGWFQRVWTFGFAYGEPMSMKTFDKALFFVTMGGKLTDEVRQHQVEAMKQVMIGDRIANRAKETEFIVFDEMTRGYGNEGNRESNIKQFLEQVVYTAEKL